MNDITEQEMTRYFSNNLRLAEKWAHTAHLSATAGKPTPCGSGTVAKYECGLVLSAVHLAFLISRYL